MLESVANTEVDLLIESANYFIFIEAKVLKKIRGEGQVPAQYGGIWSDSPVGPPVCTGPSTRPSNQQGVHVGHAWGL